MAVVVRLRRMGTKKKPFFRVVAADERTSNNGRFLENLGWYNPRQEGGNYDLNLDRIDYWTGVGARTTETVDKLIKKARRGDKPSAAANQEDIGKVKKIADLPEEAAAPEQAQAEAVETEESAAEPAAETSAELKAEAEKDLPEEPAPTEAPRESQTDEKAEDEDAEAKKASETEDEAEEEKEASS